MSVHENIRLDEEGIGALNALDIDRALANLSDDVVFHDLASPEPMRGKSAAREYFLVGFATFPDGHTEVKNRVATEDQLAVEYEFTATNTGPLQLTPGEPAMGDAPFPVESQRAKAARLKIMPRLS